MKSDPIMMDVTMFVFINRTAEKHEISQKNIGTKGNSKIVL